MGLGETALDPTYSMNLDASCAQIQRLVSTLVKAHKIYTGKEHEQKYRNKKNSQESFMKKHQAEKHAGVEPNFEARVTNVFRDCLTRQVSEGVSLRRSNVEVLNSKSEWHQPALWRVQNEIVRY